VTARRSRSRSTASSARPSRPTPTPVEVAARLLRRRAYTEGELAARLVALGYRSATAAATVARCRELGWVGDSAFAHDRARALRARGAGSLRIEADLAARGLPDDLVAEAVEASRDGLPERAWAERALGKHSDIADPHARARAWRLLASRGFPEETVADLLD
jgi:regulatory protein